ncbi:transmembrane protein 79-like [Dunckerocampus dactyliophorus]|uniref:transmembrane protein 79-like n=1 Tax=Dunckerocampus dactyliophorus TaxID=161453 RepID=UPI002405B8C2|nr:transmembrane protein 79-like [Dunckerocampus dactyliophorus]XP_054638312.1 transmembrane protein 79-like [Dunckerocampus dactyliophorus]XP_054638313.1 transmembrane protein 79-like [Dunckerocampus dactyliophorus]
MENYSLPEDTQTRGQIEDRYTRSDTSFRNRTSWADSKRALNVNRGENEEPKENHLPEKAAQVFCPAATQSLSSSRQSGKTMLEMDKSPQKVSQGFHQHGFKYDWREDTPQATDGRGCPSRDNLKVGVSLMTSAIFFPFLVWGGFVFLPFDAPLLDGAPFRLVYTLRCSVIAATPVILGWLVLGISRLRLGVVQPFFKEEQQLQDVSLHRGFISDSVTLFLLYFLQLVVMAMYLSQEQLKLVPLLTVIFAIGRLAYWVAAAFGGSSIRSFGFGLSFLPILVMMVANMVFIFTMEPSALIFSLSQNPVEVLTPPSRKQRFWG